MTVSMASRTPVMVNRPEQTSSDWHRRSKITVSEMLCFGYWRTDDEEEEVKAEVQEEMQQGHGQEQRQVEWIVADCVVVAARCTKEMMCR